MKRESALENETQPLVLYDTWVLNSLIKLTMVLQIQRDESFANIICIWKPDKLFGNQTIFLHRHNEIKWLYAQPSPQSHVEL